METTDGRYVKILEIEPINFMLRSSEEQYNILSSFASWLKISPMKLQFKSITRKADSDKHIAMIRKELSMEDNAQCKAMGEDYIRLIKDVGSREALTRRFFLIYQYEAIGRSESDDYSKIYSMLVSAEQNARAYFMQCGNSIIQPKNPDQAAAEILYMFFNRRSCVDEPFADRVNRVIIDTMAAKGKVIGVDVDQSAESKVIITSAMKELKNSVILALGELYSSSDKKWTDNLAGKTSKLGAKDNCVGLPTATESWRLTKFTVEDYKKLFDDVKAGTVSISKDTKTAPKTSIKVDYQN